MYSDIIFIEPTAARKNGRHVGYKQGEMWKALFEREIRKAGTDASILIFT